jgi:cytochrome c556
LSKALGKNDPPKGDKKSWEKLTKDYLTNAEALQKAAADKDSKAAASSQMKLQNSCKSCHGAHRG